MATATAITSESDRAERLQSMPYEEYLETPGWRTIRRLKLRQARHACQLCNSDDRQLHVHHRTYERRGRERLEDLLVLCERCHGRFHDQEDGESQSTRLPISERDIGDQDPRYRRMREIDEEIQGADGERAVELVQEKADLARELRDDGQAVSFANQHVGRGR